VIAVLRGRLSHPALPDLLHGSSVAGRPGGIE
jgi:hypothetical protein